MVAGGRGRIPDTDKGRASRRDQAPSRVSPGTRIRLESGREAPRKSWPGRRVLAPGVCSRSQPWQHACRAFPGNQPPPERSEPSSPRRHRHLGDGRGSTPRRLRGRGLGSARVERGGAWAGAEAGAAAGVSEPGRGLLHPPLRRCAQRPPLFRVLCSDASPTTQTQPALADRPCFSHSFSLV